MLIGGRNNNKILSGSFNFSWDYGSCQILPHIFKKQPTPHPPEKKPLIQIKTETK